MTMSTLTLALCVLGAPQEPAAPAVPRTLEVVSLQPCCSPLPSPEPPPFGSLLTCMQGWNVNLLGEPDSSQFTGDHVQGLLQVLHGNEPDYGELQQRVEGDKLFLLASSALQERLRAELRAVRATVERPIAIQAAVYALADALPPTIVAPAAAAAVLPEGSAICESRAVTRSNARVAFDQLRWSRYVRDVDVEVAQKANIAGPVQDAFAEGLRVVVEPHALAGSEDIVLYAQFALGQRRRVDATATGVADHPTIDLPQLESAFGAVAARVPSGGAMLVPLGGHAQGGARLVLALAARYPTPRGTDHGAFAMLPVSALTSAALATNALHIGERPTVGVDIGPTGPIQESREPSGFSWLSQGLLVELLRGSVHEEDAHLEDPAGGWLFVRGSRETIAAVGAALQALQDRLLVNVEARCTVDLREVDGGGPFAAASPNGAATTLHDIALPTLAGREAVVFRGLEQAVIRTQVPEIAQEAFALDPVVETLQGGVWLRVRPVPEPDGVQTDLFVQLAHNSPTTERFLKPAGMLMLSDTAAARFERNCVLPPGRDVVLGNGPVLTLDGKHWRPSVRVQIATR